MVYCYVNIEGLSVYVLYVYSYTSIRQVPDMDPSHQGASSTAVPSAAERGMHLERLHFWRDRDGSHHPIVSLPHDLRRLSRRPVAQVR